MVSEGKLIPSFVRFICLREVSRLHLLLVKSILLKNQQQTVITPSEIIKYNDVTLTKKLMFLFWRYCVDEQE